MFHMRYILFFLCLMFCENTLALNGGAYSSEPKKAMTLSAVNHWFIYPFPKTALPIKDATITKIYYQYALGQKDIPSGILIVKLCKEGLSYCVDISDSQSGSTKKFQGESANSGFFLYYKVINHSSIGFVTGSGSTKIMVNWHQ